MSFVKTTILMCSVALAVTACSGGGRNLGGGGTYCNLNSFEGLKTVPENSVELEVYKPADKDNKSAFEDIFTEENFPLGTYALHSATFLYVQRVDLNDRRSWIMTQIDEVVDAVKTDIRNDGTTYYKNARSCAGGYRVDTPDYETSMAGIRNFSIGNDGKVLLDKTSVWGYRWDTQAKIIRSVYTETDPVTGEEKASWSKPEEEGKYQSPKEVYGDQVSEALVHQIPVDGSAWEAYQVYTQIDLGGETYLLLKAIYRRTPPPEAPAEEELPNLEEGEVID